MPTAPRLGEEARAGGTGFRAVTTDATWLSAINRAMRLAAAMMSLPWREARHRVSSAHTLAKLGSEVEAEKRGGSLLL